MSAFTLSTIYKAVDKFSGPLKAMQAANARFAASQSKSINALRNTFSNVRNTMLSLAGGLSIAGLFGMGFNAIKDYDTALASLSAITGVTGKAFDAFKGQVIEVAGRTRKSAIDVAKAFELVGSAKPELLSDAKALGVVSEAAIVLSKASRDDLAISAQNLTGVLNQFNLGANQSARAINVLAAGSVVGAANISQVNEAMTNVGAVASTANMSLEQTVAAIEVLGSKQLFGAEAGTKLRGVILRLQAAGIGYRSGQFKINDALTEANQKISRLTTAKAKDAAMAKIFGAENITAGKIIMSNIPMFDEMTKGVSGTDWAYKQASINSATFSTILQKLKARFVNLIIKGNETSGVLNVFGKVIGFVTNNLGLILAVIGTSIGAYGAYYTIMTAMRLATVLYNIALGAFMATQNIVPIALGKSAVALNAYAIATKIASVVQWLFSAALWACPITWIVTEILVLVAGIVLLVKNFQSIVNWVKTSNNWFAVLLRFAIYPIIIAFKAVGVVIGWIIDKFSQLVTWVKTSDNWFAKFIRGGVQVLVNAFTMLGTVFSWIGDKFAVIWDWIKKIAGNAIAPILKIIELFSKGTQNELNVNAEQNTPVNTTAAANGVQTQKIEELKKNQLQIELQNKTDKQANVKFNPALIPVTTKTY
ncbi:MAG: phage tail tape measure protein [Atribacterota bacterium]|nr:phage tail tape measure protein [Atribacterota bacterium]